MKRYTSKVVSKWIQNAGNTRRERKPKPFPGLAPTRIMLDTVNGKRSFRYIGKPSRTVYNAFKEFINKPVKDGIYYTVFVEFDRSGIINFGKNNFQGVNTRTNASLWQHYHPELGPDFYPTWLAWKYEVRNGVYKIC